MNEPLPLVILASASPRRSQLLTQIGVAHRMLPVDADETPHAGETPEEYVLRVAAEKARHGWERSGGELPVLAADTAVVLDGGILGKPRDEADALEMLRRLSGREHRVLSAVALCCPANGHGARVSPEYERRARHDRFPHPGPLPEGEGEQGCRDLHVNGEQTALSISRVCFRELGEGEIRAYWRTGEPCDKAGAYAIQGLAAVFIERLEGSHSGVMGLPLFETAQLLRQAGIYSLY